MTLSMAPKESTNELTTSLMPALREMNRSGLRQRTRRSALTGERSTSSSAKLQMDDSTTCGVAMNEQAEPQLRTITRTKHVVVVVVVAACVSYHKINDVVAVSKVSSLLKGQAPCDGLEQRLQSKQGCEAKVHVEQDLRA